MTFREKFAQQEARGSLGTSEIARIARLSGGVVYRDSALIPGPGHSQDDRSLHVTPNQEAPCGFLVHSYAGDDWRNCQDYVLALLGHRSVDATKWRRPSHAHSDRFEADSIRKIQFAHRIWSEGTPAMGSSVETYLASRGLTIQPEITCLRHHASCVFKREKVEAMIAPIVNIRTNCFQGIHRTRLSPKDKAMLGPSKGGCVKLSGDDEVTEGLHICEGIETGLALLQAGFRPVWVCLSSSGVTSFPVLRGIECLTIFGDNDLNGAGLKAASDCAKRWLDVGKEVRVLLPKVAGTDFVDGRAT